MECFIQMFPSCHGVGFVSAMNAFSGSIPFSPNVIMVVYRHPLSLESSKLPFGEAAFVSNRPVSRRYYCPSTPIQRG